MSDLIDRHAETDWSYDEDSKVITLVVPHDVYNSTKSIFLSVGYEGEPGIRGMVYTAQPEVQLSPIEKALHGISPEKQADFLINLMRGTLAYIDSRVALIRWLESGCWNNLEREGEQDE